MTTKKKLTNGQLRNVGKEVASFWGGELIEAEDISTSEKIMYQFLCVEHGDEFYTELSLDDILKNYSYVL